MSLRNPVAVANYRTRLEAEVASNVLRVHGIPYLIQSGEGMLYGPLPCGASILVRRQHVQTAKRLLGLEESPAATS